MWVASFMFMALVSLTNVTDVALRPRIAFGGGAQPDAAQIDELHEAAHERCFIANSVKTRIRVEPRT